MYIPEKKFIWCEFVSHNLFRVCIRIVNIYIWLQILYVLYIQYMFEIIREIFWT